MIAKDRESGVSQDAADCFALFREILPAELLETLDGSDRRKGAVYPFALVAWLLIYQRIHGGESLKDAVASVVMGHWQELNNDNRRVVASRVSESTSSYSNARSKLTVEAARRVAAYMFSALSELPTAEGKTQRIFALDGTTISLAAEPAVKKRYPPARNQNGKSKNGLLHVLVVHDVESGYAAPPTFGSYHGRHKESEAALTKRAIDSLPEDVLYLADRGFGIFSVVHAFSESKRDFIFRLQNSRAQKILGAPSKPNTDKKVLWKVSANDKKTNPELASDSVVKGRIVCVEITTREQKREKLVLFTNRLDLSVKQLVDLYGLRWNIEVDLKTLKKTVHMESLSSKSPEMIAKELFMGICAYNLIRALIARTARRLGKEPREFSFKTMLSIVRLGMPLLGAATTEERTRFIISKMDHLAARAVLKKRKTRHATKRGRIVRGYKTS